MDTMVFPPNDSYTGFYMFSKTLPSKVPAPVLNWNPFFPEGLSDVYAESIEMEDKKDLERKAIQDQTLADAISLSAEKILVLKRALQDLGVNSQPPPRPQTKKPNFNPTPTPQPQSVKKRKRQVFKTAEEVAAYSALAIAWFNLINEEDN